MPFVKSLPLLLGHMQPEDDAVRKAAEAWDGHLAARLLQIWEGLERDADLGPRRLGDLAEDRGKHMIGFLTQAHADGQAAMEESIARAGFIQKDFTVRVNFDGPAAVTEEEAARNAAKFVREIGSDVRTTLNQSLQESTAQGLNAPDTARNLRDSIGLTAQQARAIQNYRRLLESGQPEALTRALRDARFDVPVERLASLTPDQIEQRVDAYRRRYLSYRATTIARYETLAASNGGSMNAITQSIKSGVLPPTTTVGWLIAHDERTCPRCRSIVEIQPQGVQLGQSFTWRHHGRSGTIQYAPLHPDCRCTNTFRVGR